MTKNILLTATALGVLAFAGAANATEITTATVSGASVLQGGVNTPFPVANETVNSPAARLSAAGTSVTVSLTDGEDSISFQPGVTYQFTQTYTNATLPASPTAADNFAVSGTRACYTITKSGTGGATGNAAVTYFVALNTAVGAGCDAAALNNTTNGPASVTFTNQFRATTLGDVSATYTGAVAPQNVVVGADGRADFSLPIKLAQVVDGLDVVINGNVGSGAGANTQLLLDEPVYTTLTADTNLGLVGYAPVVLDTDAFALSQARVGYGATALPTVVSTIDVTAAGGADFEDLTLTFNGDDFVADEDDANVAQLAEAAGVSQVFVGLVGAPTEAVANSPTTFAVTVTPEYADLDDASLINIDSAESGTLEALDLEGTTFLAPWVQSSNANYNTVLRLTNSGSATGPIQLVLGQSLAAPTRSVCDASVLPKLSGIAANGELAVNSTDLTTCFGAFVRGDVSVTILSRATNLTAKLRIVNPGNIVTEQSMGETSGRDIVDPT